MRQIVLDTETTGLEPEEGHRIIEIGCVELINRRLTGKTFHCYLNPDRDIDEAAIEVHGITNEFLADKIRFPQIADDFIEFIKDAELIIHNAPFDVGFLNAEFKRLLDQPAKKIEDFCKITDTLALARLKHPGQRNSLDALCRRYQIDNSERVLHGALLDAEILADVYLSMTGGQVSLGLEDESKSSEVVQVNTHKINTINRKPLPVIYASSDELASHTDYLSFLSKKSSNGHYWK